MLQTHGTAAHAPYCSTFPPPSCLQLRSLPAAGAVFTALSPASNYIVTCSKPVKDQAGNPGKNLQASTVWLWGCGGRLRKRV